MAEREHGILKDRGPNITAGDAYYADQRSAINREEAQASHAQNARRGPVIEPQELYRVVQADDVGRIVNLAIISSRSLPRVVIVAPTALQERVIMALRQAISIGRLRDGAEIEVMPESKSQPIVAADDVPSGDLPEVDEEKAATAVEVVTKLVGPPKPKEVEPAPVEVVATKPDPFLHENAGQARNIFSPRS